MHCSSTYIKKWLLIYSIWTCNKKWTQLSWEMSLMPGYINTSVWKACTNRDKLKMNWLVFDEVEWKSYIVYIAMIYDFHSAPINKYSLNLQCSPIFSISVDSMQLIATQAHHLCGQLTPDPRVSGSCRSLASTSNSAGWGSGSHVLADFLYSPGSYT